MCRQKIHRRKIYNPVIICHCANCGEIIGRRKTEVINSKTKRFFCGKLCYSQFRKNNAKNKVAQSRSKARKIFWSEHSKTQTVCTHCLGNARQLEVHHRNHNPYDNRRENLEGLCRDCHIGYHQIYPSYSDYYVCQEAVCI